MKCLALDLGDKWVGTALSDALGIVARPYKTVTLDELLPFLNDLFSQEKIDTIVIGHPITMRATESKQTEAIVQTKNKLMQVFPQYSWILWDERLSSKRAESLKKARTKEEKIKSHSIAAAFILESYLNYRHMMQEMSE
jgi:putative Holliday junction resolvase